MEIENNNETDNNTNNESLTFLDFLKCSLITDSLLTKVLSGSFDEIASSTSGLELTKMLKKKFIDYVLNEEVSYDERLKVFERLVFENDQPKIISLFKLIDKQQQKYFQQITYDLKQQVEMMGLIVGNNKSTIQQTFDEYIKRERFFRKMPKVDIVQLTEPFYFVEHPEKKRRKEIILKRLETASQEQLENISFFFATKQYNEKKQERKQMKEFQNEIHEDKIDKENEHINMNDVIDYSDVEIDFSKLTTDDLVEIEFMLNYKYTTENK